jgi:hypothetical protein
VFVLPETKFPLQSNIHENDCEKLKSMADEYLHDELVIFGDAENARDLELSEGERDFVEEHIRQCAACFSFIESESVYIENMEQAQYTPEASVSEYVAGKIIRERISVEKPRKKIIVPFGLISAAAVVLIVFIASKSGLADMFIKSSGNMDLSSADFALSAFGEAESLKDADMEMAEGMALAPEEEKAGEEQPYFLTEESAMADAPAAAPAPPAPEQGNMSYAGFWEAASGLAVEWLYRIDSGEKSGDIFKDIEIHTSDPEGGFYIVALKYKELLEKNLLEAGIDALAEAAGNPGAGLTDEKYIGILYY